jgi:hypothetical protein
LVACYFIVGIVFSTSASLSFHPKRIVSPLFVQIITSGFFGILAAFGVSTTNVNPPIDFLTAAAVTFLLFIFSLVLFSAAGIGQTMVVKYLVGLNGTKEDTNTFRLTINGKIEDVSKILAERSVREALSLDENRDIISGKNCRCFRTPLGARQQLLIAIMEDASDPKKTHLATVSYKQTFYAIMKSGDVLEEQRKETIKAVLLKGGYGFSEEDDNLRTQSIAYRHGLSVTESKLASFRSMPPYSRAIAVGLILMVVLMTAVWKWNYITFELYETFLVFAGLSVIFDLSPLLRSKRKENLDVS